MSRLAGSIRRIAARALAEDLGKAGDLSTRWFVPPRARLSGTIVAKARGVLAGMEAAKLVFRMAAPGCRFKALAKDGDRVRPGQALARIRGGRALLTAERTALNFLQRLSGIATRTRLFADRVAGTRAGVYDTRKTIPGWRELEKYAVRCGGGLNHRMGLYDMVMLKDNHLAALAASPKAAVESFRKGHPGVPVLIEAKTHGEVALAAACRADIVLLDNMGPARLRREIAFLRRAAPRTLIEVSGGVSLSAIRRIAKLGPDRISVGAITHSAPALDLSLEIDIR